MAPVQAPRGTRDFGPRDMATRRSVEATMRGVFQRFGYHEVQTPTFEELALFTAKSGEGIIDELYAFQDKGGRDLALRPELTAAVMRFYHDALSVEPKPLKLYYFGNCFRYDRPQKGRYREFWQMGCELVGPETPESVGEVLACGVGLLTAAGLNDLVVRVGDIRILQGALAAIGHPEPTGRGALMRLIDKWDLERLPAALAEDGVAPAGIDWFLALHDQTGLEGLRRHLAAAPGDARDAPAAVEALAEMVAAATALGVPATAVRIDPLIARGLDYYTGLVFEVDAPALGAEKQLLGGGRYDLSGVFDAEPVGTCGFGLGFDRTLVALAEEQALPQPAATLDAYVAPIGDAPRARALALTADLRAAGLCVEVDLMRRNPGKNLKAAAARGARFAIVIGERELEAGTATVKELASGAQETIPLDAVPARLGA